VGGGRKLPTNLNLDDRLVDEAVKVSGHRTKREAVNEALQEYIQRRRRLELVKYFGKIDFDPTWDYKKARRNFSRSSGKLRRTYGAGR
jgi:Arc/MetJ family transcription regulator